MRSRHFVPALSIIASIIVAGCGGGTNTVWVTGKLLKGGNKYTPPEDQVVNVTFVALELQDASGRTVQRGDMYTAEIDHETGDFELPGPDRRGIPPGKYRVAVTQKLKRSAYDAASQKARKARKHIDRDADMLNDQFGASTSPIVCEVKKSSDLVIDLDRPTAAPRG